MHVFTPLQQTTIDDITIELPLYQQVKKHHILFNNAAIQQGILHRA